MAKKDNMAVGKYIRHFAAQNDFHLNTQITSIIEKMLKFVPVLPSNLALKRRRLSGYLKILHFQVWKIGLHIGALCLYLILLNFTLNHLILPPCL